MVCLTPFCSPLVRAYELPPPETAIVADKKAGPNGLTWNTHEWDNYRSINKLHPMLGYLSRLKRRIVQREFLSGDSLLQAVVQAENAVHALHV
jgi:hypothetical protein